MLGMLKPLTESYMLMPLLSTHLKNLIPQMPSPVWL